MKVEFSPEFEKSLRKMIWWERLKPINPKQWYREAKFFAQRGVRGYSDRDTWNLDGYLVSVIAGGCRELAKNAHGCPGTLGHTGKTDENGMPEMDVDKGVEEWQQILEDIALGFEAFRKLQWDDEFDDIPHPDSQRAKDYQKQYEKATKLFKRYFGNLWD